LDERQCNAYMAEFVFKQPESMLDLRHGSRQAVAADSLGCSLQQLIQHINASAQPLTLAERSVEVLLHLLLLSVVSHEDSVVEQS
jgi:hypothetical protein